MPEHKKIIVPLDSPMLLGQTELRPGTYSVELTFVTKDGGTAPLVTLRQRPNLDDELAVLIEANKNFDPDLGAPDAIP